MKTKSRISEEQVLNWLDEVPDPEIPVVSVIELGMIREVEVLSDNQIYIKLTPTYTGCPAVDIISLNIRKVMVQKGFKKVTIEHQLSPAWTSDWLSETTKQKMSDYGIAPPQRKSKKELGLFEEDIVPCPQCHSEHTSLVSQFGSTSCKALYRCLDCQEPFEHFKCH